MTEPWRIACTLLVGFATGILSGMFGVGGAVLSTPAIRALGVPPIDAIGTTLPSIFPSAVSGTLRYRREGLIRRGTVVLVGATGSVAAIGFSFLSHHVPGHGHVLMIVTAGLVAFTAWRMSHAPQEPESIEPAATPSGEGRLVGGLTWHAAVVGVGAGGLSGLLGVGGGVIMVPAFAQWMGFPIKEAVGTSLACVGILAIPSTLTHMYLGDIEWAYAIPLCIGVIPGARIGAYLALRASDRGLRIAVATMLGVIAVVYAAGEIIALVQ
ncbi:MAG: sulfite exporter TauE/SafE family protein [Acidimicrobiia bacterium]